MKKYELIVLFLFCIFIFTSCISLTPAYKEDYPNVEISSVSSYGLVVHNNVTPRHNDISIYSSIETNRFKPGYNSISNFFGLKSSFSIKKYNLFVEYYYHDVNNDFLIPLYIAFTGDENRYSQYAINDFTINNSKYHFFGTINKSEVYCPYILASIQDEHNNVYKIFATQYKGKGRTTIRDLILDKNQEYHIICNNNLEGRFSLKYFELYNFEKEYKLKEYISVLVGIINGIHKYEK